MDTRRKTGILGKTVEDRIREPATVPWRALLIGGPLVALLGFLAIYDSVVVRGIRWSAPIIVLFYGIIALGLMMVVVGLVFALLNRR